MAWLIAWLEHVGLPLPSFKLLIFAGSRSFAGGASITRTTVVAVSASLMADLGWYAAGRQLGSRVVRTMCKRSVEPGSVDTQGRLTAYPSQCGPEHLRFALQHSFRHRLTCTRRWLSLDQPRIHVARPTVQSQIAIRGLPQSATRCRPRTPGNNPRRRPPSIPSRRGTRRQRRQ